MDASQTFANAPVAQPAPDTLELSGLGKYTTMLGQAQAETQRQQAIPFNQANLAGLTSNLNRIQTQNNEFMGQPATAARMAGYANDQVQAQEASKQAPLNTDMLREKARAAPFQTDADIATAGETIRKMKEAPRKALVDKMASQYQDIIKEKNPIIQAQRLKDLTEEHLAGVTDPTQRESLRSEFSGPKALEHLKTAYNESVNTSAHIQKLEEERTKGEFEVKAAQVHAGGTIRAAEIAAEAHKAVAKMAEDSPRNQAMIVAKARRTIVDPAAKSLDKDVALEIVKASTEADVQKEIANSQLSILQGKTTAEDIRAKHYANAGLGQVLAQQNARTPPAVVPNPKIKTFADLKAMYPNVPDETLRSSYKQKYGTDLQ